MVNGSTTLSFHAKKMGNATAKILKAKGKLVGKIEHNGDDDSPDRLIGRMERKPDHLLNVQVHGANGLAKMDTGSHGLCDPYTVIKFNGEKVFQTPHCTHTANPSWDAQLVNIPLQKVVVDLFDQDLSSLGFKNINHV